MPTYIAQRQHPGIYSIASAKKHHWMIDWGIAILATLTLLGALMAGPMTGSAFAWAPDKELMDVKGYSPLTTEITRRERYHQEWKPNPVPLPTKWEMFAHNLYYNNWTGSLYPFGETRIEDKF